MAAVRITLTTRDPTAAGRLSAARCRAALPGPGAKEAAWAVMLGGTLFGYELTATVQGCWQAEQAELLAGYVPRYFAALAGTAARGAGDLARIWCLHGFPHHAVDAATVRAGELSRLREPEQAGRVVLEDLGPDLRLDLEQLEVAQPALRGQQRIVGAEQHLVLQQRTGRADQLGREVLG